MIFSFGTITDTTIQVTWTVEAGAESYSVSIYDSSNNLIETKNILAAEYNPLVGVTFTGLQSGTEYTVSGSYSINDFATKALLHFEDGATDETGKSWTLAGNATVSSAQARFGTQSLYCDGSLDYILGPNSSDFDFGAEKWTIEWWEYPLNSTHLYFSRDQGNGYTISPWGYINANGVYLGSDTGWVYTGLSLGAVANNEWTHYALVRDADRFYTFRAGQKVSETVIGNLTFSPGISGPQFGMDRDARASFNGYVDELRISKGAARWVNNFSTPTAPYSLTDLLTLNANAAKVMTTPQTLSLSLGVVERTSMQVTWPRVVGAHGYVVSIYDTSNTLLESKNILDRNYVPETGATFEGLDTALLSYNVSGYVQYFVGGPYTKNQLSFDGAEGQADFIDDAGVEWTATNAVVTTAQARFGGSSGYFLSPSYIAAGADEDWNFGTGEFAIDCWLWVASHTSTDRRFLSQQSGAYMFFRLNGANRLAFGASGCPSLIDSATFPTQQWVHVAVTRSGDMWRLFRGGQIVASATSSVSMPVLGGYYKYIGGDPSGGVGEYYTGYIDEMRVSKGDARWTEAFTPPEAPYSVENTAVSSTLAYIPPASKAFLAASLDGKLVIADNGLVCVKVDPL